jgi:glycosyltransferase involved in cell wall biosynthesis
LLSVPQVERAAGLDVTVAAMRESTGTLPAAAAASAEDERSGAPGDGRPIRVAAYTDATVFGGCDQVLASLLSALGERFEITVLGIDGDVVEQVAESRPGTAIRVLRRVRSKWDAPGIAGHIRAVRDLRPDVLHASLPHPWSCQYGIIAGLLNPGVRTVAVQHAILPARVRRQAWLNHLTLSRLDAHIALSPSQARLIEEMARLPPGSMKIIHNGIADFRVDAEPRPVDGPIVGSVGRLSPEKGFDLLLRALKQIPGLTAVIAGRGAEREQLERLADELGVANRVVMPGFVPDARTWMAMYDVFAVPSRSEGMPLALIEAMLASRPVVVTAIGGMPDVVVDGETGLVVPPEDPDALAEALRTLFAEDGTRVAMGTGGRARAREEFSFERMVDSYEALYEDLVSPVESSRDPGP